MTETKKMSPRSRQLEELHLVFCSLLPGESLSFSPTADDEQIWTRLLESYPDVDVTLFPTASARFEIKVAGSGVWFEVNIPTDYGMIEESRPVVSVRGESISRSEQAHWEKRLAELMHELNNSDYIVYELVSTHLLPLLHTEAEAQRTSASQKSPRHDLPTPEEHYHALLTSHHLISPTKRKNMQLWSSQLQITGFAKVGYPGIMYAEGAKDDVEDFVNNIKAMQWLALRVRFVEPVHEGGKHDRGPRTWIELEKVGEVVEEMRRIGREGYVVEMGIGSASS